MNCKVCEITNLTEVRIFTDLEIDQFIKDIVSGVVKIDQLDTNQYLRIARKLSDSIDSGFGNPLFDNDYNEDRHRVYNSFLDNVYSFAAHKQYQLVREIIDIAESKKVETKEEFYLMAVDLFNKYNVTYLTTELDSAEWQARGAKDWLEFVKWDNAEE